MANEQQDKGQDEPKIIVDDDWKAQARAEKERLAQATAQQGPGATSAAEDDQQHEQGEPPPASFSGLVSFLVAQIMFALGGAEDPDTKRRYVDLDLARHYIDTLNVLEEKTSGNLTDDEKRLLDRALYETRMQYVAIAQAATRIGPR